MPKSSSPKAVDALTFEEAYAELEALVETLEGEQKPLDDALALYERGQALIKRCALLLDRAELKVKQLAGDELKDFEAEEA
jgi:exodeoxyribonuclease VII small subunit